MTRTLLLAVWALVGVLLVGCEVLALVSRRRYSGIQGLLDHLTMTNLRLVAAFVGWLWMGWHFFAR